jgi:hypothetical protein
LRRIGIAVALILLASPPSRASAQVAYTDRQLKGIRRVFIVVPSDLTRIDTTAIRTKTELELRRLALVPVQTIDSSDATVGIVVIPTPSFGAVSVYVAVVQDAQLRRDPAVPGIATWTSRIGVAATTPSNVDRTIQDLVRSALDELANAFLSANPK